MAKRAEEGGCEKRPVTDAEAAFIVGAGGKTKSKLSTVSGAQIDLVGPKPSERGEKGGTVNGNHLEIRGSPDARKRARKYIEFLIKQRQGPVNIEDPSAHDDLTILVVPADTVSYVTGARGSSLRLVEEEWGALLFFLQVDPKNPPSSVDPNRTERLAIFGPERSRRGAELKVMATIETKSRGYFTKNLTAQICEDDRFATDTVYIQDEDYNYAIGRAGTTRRKLARASHCIVEYVGKLAHFCGSKQQRTRAREYMSWLLMQRVGKGVVVDHRGREDVSCVVVPTNCIGYVSGHKGQSLRQIEEETSTFCFVEGQADDGEAEKTLMIFGRREDRQTAETLVWDRVSNKIDEGAAPNSNTGEDRYGSRKGKGKDKGKGSSWQDRQDGKGGKNGGGSKGNNRQDYKTANGDEKPEKRGTIGPPPPNLPPADEKKPQWRTGADGESEFLAITDKDAAFLMGPGGKTKRKIAGVSGALLELNTNVLAIKGNSDEREKAKKYVQLVIAQRIGPVHLTEADSNGDLSIMEVPADAVSFVTGAKGSFLRQVEDEFGTLLFFIDFDKTNRRDQVERLAIFGQMRDRRGAELKVMSAIEMKHQGYFTVRDIKRPEYDTTEGFGTDRMKIEEDDYSYALGKGGATRKKIARASGCIIEYVGELAYLSGSKKERTRAREYLTWLFQQRIGAVEVNYTNRDDVTVLQVPKDCVGFVTGHKGTSLRAVEDATGAFCFIEGGRDDPHRDPKPLLVFGNEKSRKEAEIRLRAKIEQKLVEGWVAEDDRGGDGYGKKGGKGGGKKGGKGDSSISGKAADAVAASPAAGGHPASRPKEEPQSQPQDDDEAWGDWGGSSEDDVPKSAAPSGGGSAQVATPHAASPNKAATAGGQAPRQQPGSPYPYQQPAGYATAAGATRPSGSPSGSLRVGGEELRDVELPPQLLHEEAWPDLADMAGGPKKGKRR